VTGSGPVVCVDEGHHNFHTLDGEFWAFGELLRSDGYQLRVVRGNFKHSDLSPCVILVIANAQPSDESWDTYPYPTPPAFTRAEAAALHRWVEGGGALLLIADHLPFPGAAAPVAKAFGFEFNDGAREVQTGDANTVYKAMVEHALRSRWDRPEDINDETFAAEIELTVDDPKTYTRPFTIQLQQRLIPDSDLLESYCAENEKDVRHVERK
jgi:hypothetical protein